MTSPPAPGHVFITYASSDVERVLPIARALRDAGIPVWLDRWSIEPGMNWPEAIERAIADCSAMIVMCTVTSLRSDNVHAEIQLAWESERRQYLPVILDKDSYPKNFPAGIRYPLTGRQYVEVLDRPLEEWLSAVVGALRKMGIEVAARAERQIKRADQSTTEIPAPALFQERIAADSRAAAPNATKHGQSVSKLLLGLAIFALLVTAVLVSLPTRTGTPDRQTESTQRPSPQEALPISRLEGTTWRATWQCGVGGTSTVVVFDARGSAYLKNEGGCRGDEGEGRWEQRGASVAFDGLAPALEFGGTIVSSTTIRGKVRLWMRGATYEDYEMVLTKIRP